MWFVALKITDIKTTTVAGNFQWLLVKIETDERIEGFGETTGENKSIVLSMKPRLIGEDPTDVKRLWRKMRPSIWSGFNYLQGLTAVETALLDLTAKSYGIPVWKFLGGKVRNEVPIYCDCHTGKPIASFKDYAPDPVYSTPEAYAENARRIKNLGLGFKMIKFDYYWPDITIPGAKQGSAITDIGAMQCAKTVEAIREVIGYDMELGLDFGAGGVYVSNAIRFAKAIEEYRLAFVEDLLPPTDVVGWAVVTSSITTATLTGEVVALVEGFKELIERHAIKIPAPDFQRVGGLMEGQRIAELAEDNNLLVAPHCISSPIGEIASVHLCATIPNLIALEWHAVAVPWWENLVKGIEKPLLKNGCIKVPDKPGLGIELDEQEIRKHLAEGETYFE